MDSKSLRQACLKELTLRQGRHVLEIQLHSVQNRMNANVAGDTRIGRWRETNGDQRTQIGSCHVGVPEHPSIEQNCRRIRMDAAPGNLRLLRLESRPVAML